MKKNVKRTFLLSFLSLFVLLSIIFVVHIIYMRNKSDILDGIEFSRTYLDKNNELLQVFLTKDEKYSFICHNDKGPSEIIHTFILSESDNEIDVPIDYITDKRIRESIYKLYKDKMIILITQRVNNLTGFDKIIVIESGKIEMVGNYLDVVNTSKVFNEFIESQKREVSK